MSDENSSYTEVTSTSWFSRLGNSFKGISDGDGAHAQHRQD